MAVDLGLEGKRALVTGAAVGIGRGIARWLAAAGCDVVLADKDAATLAEAAAEVAGAGTRVVAAPADLRDPDAVRALVARVVDELGGLDVAVNNVGSLAGRMPAAFVDLDDDALRDVVEQNLFVTMWSCHAEAKAMLAAGTAGVIVNVTSGETTRAVAAHGALRRGQGRDQPPHRDARGRARTSTASACSPSRRAPPSRRSLRPRCPTSRSRRWSTRTRSAGSASPTTSGRLVVALASDLGPQRHRPGRVRRQRRPARPQPPRPLSGGRSWPGTAAVDLARVPSVIVVVAALKGGVGKTTTAVYLAAVAGAAKRSVTLVDSDPQASAADWVEHAADEVFESIDVVEAPTERLLVKTLDRIDGDDVAVVDTPPGHERLLARRWRRPTSW